MGMGVAFAWADCLEPPENRAIAENFFPESGPKRPGLK
jgi:hypothetical protein